MNEKPFYIQTGRIEQFSDGVFAIIITLMVLQLKVPHFQDGASLEKNWQQLLKSTSNFISFFLSFVFIAVYWVNHHQLFQSIKVISRKLLWHNIHLLFWLTVIPFPSAMVGEYPQSPLAVMCLAFVFFMASLASYLMQRHALINADLMHETLSTKSKEGPIKKNLVSIFLYIIIIVAAPFYLYLAYSLFAIAVGMFIVPPELNIKSKISTINKNKKHET